MRRSFALFLFMLSCQVVYSQSERIADSLFKEATNLNNDARLRFGLYYKLAALVMAKDIETSLNYAKKANEIALENNYPEELTKSYLLMTSAYIEGGYIEEALETGRKGLQLAIEKENYLFQFYGYRNIATVFRREANYDSSLFYYIACVKVSEQHLSDTFVSAAYTGLGAYYTTLDELDKAEEYHKKALELRIKLKDTASIANSYNNLGIVNRELGDYKKALYYYNKTREVYLARNDSSDIAYIYNDLGAIYSKSGLLDSGEYYLLKSIEIRLRMKELIELAYTYNYLGENYEKKGNLPKAEYYIKKALALAVEIKNNKQHYEAYESLSDFYARNRMYDSAYTYLQLYKSFRDSIRRMDNEQMITELNTKYETEKKEKKIQEQQFEITKKNYLLAGGVTFLILALMLGFSAYRRYRLKEETNLQAAILKQQELATKAVIEAEENERQRIAGDLHDGVGQMMSAAKINLSTISNDITFSDEEQKLRFENALKLVDDSCAEVRNVSHNIMPNSLLRNSLAAAVRMFINKIDQNLIKINLHTEGLNEKLEENVEIMLYRVVQECVNNVIKHAKANTLDISLIKDSNEITVTIEDNGKGFDAADKSKFDGIGLKNIKTRIQYLKGSVEWDSAPGRGTVVSIHVPLS